MANIQTIKIDFFNANYSDPRKVTMQTIEYVNTDPIYQVIQTVKNLFTPTSKWFDGKTIIAPFIPDPQMMQVDWFGNVYEFKGFSRGNLMAYRNPKRGTVLVDSKGCNTTAWAPVNKLYTVIQHG